MPGSRRTAARNARRPAPAAPQPSGRRRGHGATPRRPGLSLDGSPERGDRLSGRPSLIMRAPSRRAPMGFDLRRPRRHLRARRKPGDEWRWGIRFGSRRSREEGFSRSTASARWNKIERPAACPGLRRRGGGAAGRRRPPRPSLDFAIAFPVRAPAPPVILYHRDALAPNAEPMTGQPAGWPYPGALVCLISGCRRSRPGTGSFQRRASPCYKISPRFFKIA